MDIARHAKEHGIYPAVSAFKITPKTAADPDDVPEFYGAFTIPKLPTLPDYRRLRRL
jgi:hypothetical protein